MFWVFLGGTALSLVFVLVYGEGKGVLAALVGLWAFTSFIVWAEINPPNVGQLADRSDVRQTCHVDLVALGTGNSTEIDAHFGFLGGSINAEGFQTITYATQREDGAVVLDQKRADMSGVFEDAPEGKGWMQCIDEPIMYDPSFIFPWAEPERTGYRLVGYEFHVPPGSVARDFIVVP